MGRVRPGFRLPRLVGGHPGPRLIAAISILWAVLVIAWSAGRYLPVSSALSSMVVAAGYASPTGWLAFLRAGGWHLAWLAVPAMILVSAWLAGSPVLALLGMRDQGPVRPVLRVVMGFGVLASFHHGLGLSGLFFIPLLAGCGAGFFIAGCVSAARTRPWRALTGFRPFRGSRALASACLVSVGLLFFMARLPDAHSDARIYHFAAPEHYLKLHKIVAQPEHFSFHIPRAFEMVATTPWALGGISAGKMAVFSASIVTVLLVFLLALELGGSGWLAAAFFLSLGVLPSLVWQGKNDPLMAALAVAGFMCVLRGARERRRVPWLAGGAWLLGSAMSVKYNAGFVAGGAVLALAALPWKGVHARGWLVAGALGLVPLAEWLMESWLYLGNPFHPFLSGIFPQVSWGPFYRGGMRAVVLAYSPPDISGVWGVLSGAWRVLGDPGFGFPLIILLLPFVPGVKAKRKAGFLALSIVFAFLAWATTERVARMAFAIVPLAAALASSAPVLGAVKSRLSARFDPMVSVICLIFIVSSAVVTVPLGGWLVLAGQKKPADYLRERFGAWDEVREWVNGNIPARSTVLFTGEEHRLWFRPLVSSHHDVMEPVPWKLSRESFTADRMRIKMRQAGITYLLHNYLSSAYRRLLWWPGPEWSNRQLRVYDEFMRRYSRPVYISPRVDLDNGGFYVFEITKRPLSGESPAVMLPFTEGRWLRPYSLMRGGDLNAAWAEARKEFAPMADVLQVRFVLATLAERRGDWKGAMELLEPAIRGGLVDNGSWSYYGALLARQGNMDGAVRAFSRSALLTGDQSSLSMLGRALRDRARERKKAGNEAGAKKDLEASRYLPGR